MVKYGAKVVTERYTAAHAGSRTHFTAEDTLAEELFDSSPPPLEHREGSLRD